jgi:hypothetical protein
MKNISDNIVVKKFSNHPIFKISLFSGVYISVLIFVSPFIDHLFTSLEKDVDKKESNLQILIEVILHVIVLSITWYYISNFMKHLLIKIFKFEVKEPTATAIDFVTALGLIGLQKNLIDKLEYITLQHPFRYHLPSFSQ